MHLAGGRCGRPIALGAGGRSSLEWRRDIGRAMLCMLSIVGGSAPVAFAQLTALRVVDYAAAPITGQLNGGNNNRASLARINFLAEEPGGADRLFVNDSNGPLYILDKQTREFSTYLDFNGSGSATGLFDKLPISFGFASGLVTFQFDPDYVNNGKFYTVHTEDPGAPGSALPNNSSFPGLNTAGYTATAAYVAPGTQSNERDSVLIEWTDTDTSNNTFEGSARELLRVQLNQHLHPIGDLIFNPTAQPGDADWRVMYVAVGEGGAGEMTNAATRLNPQRLDLLAGKVLRIIPDLAEHTDASTVSENGRYRVPDDNPFVDVAGARPEIYTTGHRNPHRMSWDVDPLDPENNQLIVNEIGLYHWEEVNFIQAGANYGYGEREGNERLLSSNSTTSLPTPDTIPWQLNATTTDGTVTPTYPVIQYGHALSGQSETFAGDAISSGFVYRGSNIPQLYGKFIFGDLTTGSLFYADYEDMQAADNGDAAPLADADLHVLGLLWDDPYDDPDDGEELYETISTPNSNSNYSVQIEAPLFQIVEEGYKSRGGENSKLPGAANITGNLGRADIRLQVDDAGELYLLSKADGMIRAIVGPEPLAGDFNYDGSVDSADYQMWKAAYGTTVPRLGLWADGNADGVVNAADYTVWRDNFMASGSGSHAVPEPPVAALALAAAVSVGAVVRRRAAKIAAANTRSGDANRRSSCEQLGRRQLC